MNSTDEYVMDSIVTFDKVREPPFPARCAETQLANLVLIGLDESVNLRLAHD